MPRFSGIVSCAPCPLHVLLACQLLDPAEHVQNVRGHDQSSGARPLSEGGCIVMKAGSLDEPATVRAASDSTLASAPTLGRPRRWSPSTRFPRKTLLRNLTSIRGAKLHAQVTRSPATTLNLPCLHGGDWLIATSFHKPRQIQVHFTMRVIIVFLASLVLVATRTLAAAAETKKTWQNQMLL